jgi:hypothetical protein
VIDAYVIDNSTGATMGVGGINLPPQSLYVAVVGGSDADVARAIWKKKSPGCRYYAGNTTVTVKDTSSGYDVPYPSYQVTFQRPSPVDVYFKVNLTNNGIVPSDVQTRVRAAIVAAFNGEDGGPRARIGAKLYASRFYANVAALGPWAQIISILVGQSSNPTDVDILVPIDGAPVLNAANIAVNLV